MPSKYNLRPRTSYELRGNGERVALLSRILVGREPLSISDKLVLTLHVHFDWEIERKSRGEISCLAKVRPM